MTMLNAWGLLSRRKNAAGGGGGGGVYPSVDLRNASFNSDSGFGFDATVTYAADGTSYGTSSGPAVYTWLIAGAIEDIEIRATETYGNAGGAATDVWLPLTAGQTWTKHSGTAASVTLYVEMRAKADFAIIASCTVTLFYENLDDGGVGGPL